MKKLFKNKKGFTLVELMVVVAIMGVLVAVAIPVFNNVTEKARTNACVTTQRTIESAYSMAKAQGTDVTTGGKITFTQLVPKYIAEEPKCPKAGTYSIDANGVVKCSDKNHTKAVAGSDSATANTQ